ncbi:hypothetical protein ACLB1R_35770 [Escherichia coli]
MQSICKAARAADISLQLLTDRVSGEMNYVIVIGRHEGLLQSEAIDPNADKQYRENRHSRHFIPVTDANTKALKKTCKVMKTYIKGRHLSLTPGGTISLRVDLFLPR